MTFLSIEAGALMDWIFLPTMAAEVARLGREDQESGNGSSYFPYQSDMGLVQRSAYSSNANPYLFHWIHILGSLLGHRRSINARFNFEGALSDLNSNAILMAWAFSKGGDLKPQYSQDGKEYGQDIKGPDVQDMGGDYTEVDKTWLAGEGRSPDTWYILYKSNGGFPSIVNKMVKKQRGLITNARDSSVGAYVKDLMYL